MPDDPTLTPPAASAPTFALPGGRSPAPVNPLGGYTGAGGDEPDLDDDLGEPTDLAALEAELLEEVAVKARAWENPNRPGWAAQYRLNLDEATVARARRKGVVRKARSAVQDDIVDNVTVNATMLAHYNTGLLRNGREVMGTGNTVLTFRSPELQALYGVDSSVAAVRKFYGEDGPVLTTGAAVLQAAGWMDEADEAESPTEG